MLPTLRVLSMVLVSISNAACVSPRATPTADAPLVALDHVFVVVPDSASAVATLAAAGITVDTGTVSRHEGNGTASLSALFENAYLEILWVDSSVSVGPGFEQSVATLKEASVWKRDGPSPFGIGLRRVTAGVDEFPYRGSDQTVGEWVEDGQTFFVFDSDRDQPGAFIVPEFMSMSTWGNDARSETPWLFEHTLDLRRLTRVRLHIATPLSSVQEAGFRFIEYGDPDQAPLLVLEFDEMRQGITEDLRPKLPILIRR